jgi:hypothetical protein
MTKRMSLESNTDRSATDFSSNASDEHELLGVDHDQTP